MNSLPVRAVFAFLALPGIVAFIVPLWIAMSGASRPAFNPVCLPVLVLGIFLLLWCVRDFYVAGRGTLAPWSPPKHLVVVGLYRFSRNPMYIAVILILSGWAIGFSSFVLMLYAVTMVILFQLRVIFHEEPWLERAFGDGWVRYRTDVPRWIGWRSLRIPGVKRHGSVAMSGSGSDFGLGRIGQISVPVTDIERAIRFYRDILGMQFLFQAPPGLGFFNLDGVRLMLDGPAKASAGNGSVIYYKVEDLQSAFETLSMRGVQFEAAPHLIAKMPDHDLWMAFLRDPDNNLIALMCEIRK